MQIKKQSNLSTVITVLTPSTLRFSRNIALDEDASVKLEK